MSGGFTSVRVLGGLLPSDVLASVADGSAAGLSTDDYHLGGERPREAAARTWSHLLGVYQRFRSDLSRLREDDPAVSVTRERWLTQLLATFDYGRALPLHDPEGFLMPLVGRFSPPLSAEMERSA